ncbi:MAG TPA: tRNA (cytidine(34)-2'-O)-methyltransferase [Chlamydiales bacterium]|nr:tRNA (cytidine(34)-2'-O)-methyltransferase [Chlamydiales bacterium]
MKIVLFQPQIPQNTGNIVRTCSVTGSGLILVRPLGFSTQNRWLKRAGLDYWEGVEVEEIDNLADSLEKTESSFFFFSSKSKKFYTEAPYDPDSLLIFGSETAGLPSSLWKRWGERFYTIPMLQGTRCLNLASSAAIVLYEGLRQIGFTKNLQAPSTLESLVQG